MSELVYMGGALKALDDAGKVGGYLVRFTDASRKDLDGEYFTAKTYFGARDADGADCLMHHMQPLPDVPRELTDHIFAPLKTTKDDVGIFAETILDLADKYEKKVFELIGAGKLGFSSGAADHTVIKAEDGEIKRWLIAEGSFTPIPAEPQNKVMSLKSYADLLRGDTAATAAKGMFEEMIAERVNSLWFLSDLFMSGCYQLMYMDEAAEDAAMPFDVGAKFDELAAEYTARVKAAILNEDSEEDGSPLKFSPLAGLPFNKHSDTALAAVEAFARKATALTAILSGWSGRFKSISELRIKEGRAISAVNKEKVTGMHDKLKEAHGSIADVMSGMRDLVSLGEKTESSDDPMKFAGEIQANIMRRRNAARLAQVA